MDNTYHCNLHFQKNDFLRLVENGDANIKNKGDSLKFNINGKTYVAHKYNNGDIKVFRNYSGIKYYLNKLGLYGGKTSKELAGAFFEQNKEKIKQNELVNSFKIVNHTTNTVNGIKQEPKEKPM